MKKGMRRVVGFLLALALIVTSGVLPETAGAKAKKIKLNKSKATIKVKKTVKLKVKNAPKKAKVKWSSNKKKIATVTKKGVVKGKKKGTAVITAKVTYKKGKKKVVKRLKCKVTVKKAAAAVKTATPAASADASAAPAASADVTTAPAASADVSAAPEESKEPTITRTEERINPETGEKETVTKEFISKDDHTVRKDIDSITLINEYMGQGINLGNTFEASLAKTDKLKAREAIDVDAFESAWGAPYTTQEIIDGYKSYGFNTIRIPVAWSNMIDENDPEYKINDAFMNRIEEVVNYCLNDEMYVILNIHWDSGWWSQFGQGEEWNKKAHARFESFWTQISERFKDYSDRLIFESANEEFSYAFNHEIDEDGYRKSVTETGNLTRDEQYELANELNQKFVDIVRASGGNNVYRHLLLAGIQTDFAMTADERFKMPKDADVQDSGVNKLSVSVHYYTPWGYCGDGQPRTNWGSDSDKQEMIDNFLLLKRFTDEGYGIMLGEYGVCVAQHNNIPEFMKAVINQCKNKGILPVLWDTPGLYYNRKKCTMRYADIGELFNKITGANGDTSSPVNTGVVNREITFENPENLTLKWSWEGIWTKNDGNNYAGAGRYREINPVTLAAKWKGGKKITETDPDAWYTTTACTDPDGITFNSWGYCAGLALDWTQFKEPYIMFTYIDPADEAQPNNDVGELHIGTVDEKGGEDSADMQKIPYNNYNGKCVSLPLTDLIVNGYLYFTFSDCPIVTGVYVYDKE